MDSASRHTLRHDLPLSEQLNELTAAVRKTPGDVKLRTHLAQLSMVMGNWERAVSQLQTASQLDPASIPMAQAYREAIRCERVRERVFAGEISAQTVGEPAPWFAQLAQALTSRAQGDASLADDLQAQAFDQAAATPFSIDGREVAWLADADSRLGPLCEVFLNGQYYWLPFERIRSLEIEEPSDLRDLVWIPATLTLSNEGQHPVLIPSRYPRSHEQGNDRLALSTLTEWQPLGEDTWAGLGQRMLVSDQDDHPFLSVRKLLSLATEESVEPA
ncbi:type VI secretion system accessory protein TagJ [Pseudomonas sp. RIT-PI-AD]|uniref:type VI secretion system accessory protein TagJ n=1 Tax=Pseudomonas sp. RIT-PI-AD TaxID=3035294 RepID=UPI0021DAEC69|nr:type VI secretion system accessory protein TagJ [Pseudomonas sp. RIT-PI-AD]